MRIFASTSFWLGVRVFFSQTKSEWGLGIVMDGGEGGEGRPEGPARQPRGGSVRNHTHGHTDGRTDGRTRTGREAKIRGVTAPAPAGRRKLGG